MNSKVYKCAISMILFCAASAWAQPCNPLSASITCGQYGFETTGYAQVTPTNGNQPYSYIWSVSNGWITSGQGTNRIEITGTSSVTASVTVWDDPLNSITKSCTISFGGPGKREIQGFENLTVGELLELVVETRSDPFDIAFDGLLFLDLQGEGMMNLPVLGVREDQGIITVFLVEPPTVKEVIIPEE